MRRDFSTSDDDFTIDPWALSASVSGVVVTRAGWAPAGHDVAESHDHDEAHSHGFYYDDNAAEQEPEFEDYVLGGIRWTDSGGSSSGNATGTLGGSGGVVAWSLAGAGLTNQTGQSFFTGATVNLSSYFSFDYVSVLRAAFDAWSAVANIEFIQVADGGGNIGVGGQPTIRIVGAQIDGPFNVLARAFFPHSSAAGGDLVFDTGETSFWTAQSFFLVAVHEIGHALGLNHEPSPPSGNRAVMNPTYNSSLTGLQPDDINGIRAVYGAQDFGPNTYYMPVSQLTLTLIDSAPNLTVVGNALGNTISGTAGNDTIVGRGGADTIRGGAGDDVLAGNDGNDTIAGDDGNDSLGADDGNDIINGGAGNDTVWGGNGDDQVGGGSGNDIVVGDAGNDSVWGEDGDDIVNGGAGDDILLGGNGNDQFGGGSGNDIVQGEAGNDTVWGEEGDDLLVGGTGDDILIGGPGNDTFVFNAGDGSDVIVDFVAGGSEDRIWFNGTNLHSFADVQANTGYNAATNVTTITYIGGVVMLNGVAPNQFTADDFLFT